MVVVVVAVAVAVVYCGEYVLYHCRYIILLGCLSILLLKGFFLFCTFIFYFFKNNPTRLCLSIDKIKGQFDKNTILIHNKTLPNKK